MGLEKTTNSSSSLLSIFFFIVWNLTNYLFSGITKDMDLTSFRVPIGVCAGIAPFNFPAMIPLWMFPMGVITGNTYIMKPSERDPGACMALVELLQEAGCPPGNYFAMSTESNENISD